VGSKFRTKKQDLGNIDDDEEAVSTVEEDEEVEDDEKDEDIERDEDDDEEDANEPVSRRLRSRKKLPKSSECESNIMHLLIIKT